MVCCCMPCIRKCQGKLGDSESTEDIIAVGMCTLVTTEIIRWITVITPLYLCIWQYTEYRGFAIFVSDADEEVQFWCIVSAIIVALSLLVYLPLKVAAVRFRLSKNKIKDHRWRPSIVVYIVLCALPCLTLVLVATKNPQDEPIEAVMSTEAPDPCFTAPALDAEPAAVLQITVFGLTVTEWMSKLREEVMTYDLITAMAIDFFFAYDVIAFIMITAKEPHVFNSEWVYVCFVFAWIAMFKYVPTQPVSIYENGAPKGAATGIVVTLLCCDVPFVVVRLSTFFIFGFEASDFIHPAKNIGMICFGLTQLWFIYRNTQDAKKHRGVRFSEKRISKHPGAWCELPDDNCVTPTCDPDEGKDVTSVHSNASYVPDTCRPAENKGRGQMDGDLQVSDLD